jgi:hypothetical protein
MLGGDLGLKDNDLGSHFHLSVHDMLKPHRWLSDNKILCKLAVIILTVDAA